MNKFNTMLKALICSAVLQVFPYFVHAEGSVGNIPPDSGGVSNIPDTKLDNPLKDEFSSIPALLSALLDLVVMIAIPIAILFLIYAGFLFVTARGDEKQITTARKALLATIVGIAVIVGAALIANVIDGTIDQLKDTSLDKPIIYQV